MFSHISFNIVLLLNKVLSIEKKHIEQEGVVKLNLKNKIVKEESETSNNFTRGISNLSSEKCEKKLIKQLNNFLKSKFKLPIFRNRNINRDVLVVARNFQTRYLFEILLRKQGFSVTTISNVDEILDIINGNYKVILFDETDYNTEDLDIIELIKMSNPEVKLLTISRNLKSNHQTDVSSSNKMVLNYRVKVVGESPSKISNSFTIKEITINKSV